MVRAQTYLGEPVAPPHAQLWLYCPGGHRPTHRGSNYVELFRLRSRYSRRWRLPPHPLRHPALGYGVEDGGEGAPDVKHISPISIPRTCPMTLWGNEAMYRCG